MTKNECPNNNIKTTTKAKSTSIATKKLTKAIQIIKNQLKNLSLFLDIISLCDRAAVVEGIRRRQSCKRRRQI